MQPIRLDDLKPADPTAAAPTGVVPVIVKVRTAHYVPPGVTVRARIDDCLFTADVDAARIPHVEQDPQVVSVAANRKLRIVD